MNLSTWTTARAGLFVAAVWLFMLLFNLVLVWRHSLSVPFQDEFGYVRWMTGDEPLSLGWLWQQHGEDRIPLGKLIWVFVLRLTQYNFRLANCLSVLTAGGLVLAMICAAKAVRGRTAYSDAFFPLALLNPSQAINFLWWWQVNQLLVPFMGGVLLIFIVVKGNLSRLATAIPAGLSTALLPLCGPGGLLYSLAGATWLACRGSLHWSSPEPHAKRDSLLMLLFAGAIAVFVGAYFISLSPGPFPQSHDLRPSLNTAIEIFSLSFGTASASSWKFWGLGVVSLWLTSMALLALVWWKRPQERSRTLGLFLVLGAAGSMILATGRASSAKPITYVWAGHYVTLAVPLLCAIYFVWELYESMIVGPFVKVGLFTAMCLLLLPNASRALTTGRYFQNRTEAFERDLHDGLPPFILAERHGHFLTTWVDPDQETHIVEFLVASMRYLHRAGVDPFRLMSDDPVFREIAPPLAPPATGRVARSLSTGSRSKCEAHLTFALTESKFVYAIRLRFDYRHPTTGPMMMYVAWRDNRRRDFVTEEQYENVDLNFDRPAKPSEQTGLKTQTVTVWINDSIDQFCVYSDNKASVFHLSEITLLVPVRRISTRR